MKRPRRSIATADSHDFLPMVIGGIFLFISTPGFLMVLFNSDRSSKALQLPLGSSSLGPGWSSARLGDESSVPPLWCQGS